MAYSSKKGRRPIERASKISHTEIINNPIVQDYLNNCDLPRVSAAAFGRPRAIQSREPVSLTCQLADRRHKATHKFGIWHRPRKSLASRPGAVSCAADSPHVRPLCSWGLPNGAKRLRRISSLSLRGKRRRRGRRTPVRGARAHDGRLLAYGYVTFPSSRSTAH